MRRPNSSILPIDKPPFNSEEQLVGACTKKTKEHPSRISHETLNQCRAFSPFSPFHRYQPAVIRPIHQARLPSVRLSSIVRSIPSYSNSCCHQPAPDPHEVRVSLQLPRTLAEESAHGSLGVGREGVEQLVGVEAGGLHEFAGGVDDALRHVALQGFGLESLGDVGEALGGLGVDGGVGSGWGC